MDGRIWLFLIVWQMMLSWICATNINMDSLHQGQKLQSPQTAFVVQQGIGSKANEEELALSRVGSRPPRCEHKCRGCAPCTPIQVPAVHHHVTTPQYSNYEPEGWKCMCASIFYNP